jgi:DNA polymerase-1
MPRSHAKTLTPIDEDTLRRAKLGGFASEVLEARLEYAEATQLLTHYILPMTQVQRVHPTHLPTQASLRWSTTDPPLTNFPSSIRDVVGPDPGWKWICWDFDAIEAKLAAAYSGDEEDLAHFRQGHDIHTITACQALGMDLPPTLTKALHGDDASAKWRARYQWEGDEDKRRRLYKTARYALAYGMDENAILQAKGVEELGVTRAELLATGRAYLKSKPKLRAWKEQVWTECIRTGHSRTFLGAKRLLLGDTREQMKIGLNHMIQGAVSGILNLTLIRIFTAFPDAILAYTSHDAAKIAVPQDHAILEPVRQIVEADWDIGGHRLRLTGSWKEVLGPPA